MLSVYVQVIDNTVHAEEEERMMIDQMPILTWNINWNKMQVPFCQLKQYPKAICP